MEKDNVQQPLPVKEKSKKLKKLEQEIAVSLVNGFVSVGLKLEVIQREQLYKQTHKRFNDYHYETFELTRPHAYRYINGAKVYKLIEKEQPKYGYKLPLYESQVRPLTKIKDETVVGDLWNVAWIENGQRLPSANVVDRVVKEKLAPPKKDIETENEEAVIVSGDGLIRLSQITKRYSVIYADPPWRYTHTPTKEISPDSHYETLKFEELVDIGIQHIANPDCVLFLWCTSPKLDEGIYLINKLGFRYVSSIGWVKEKPAEIGYWVKSAPEYLLIGIKGDIRKPDFDKRADGYVYDETADHSRKPKTFYKIIEDLTVGLQDRIELFAREIRPGWDCWGDEVGYHQCEKNENSNAQSTTENDSFESPETPKIEEIENGGQNEE